MSENVPTGADHSSDAPWHSPGRETITKEVTATVSYTETLEVPQGYIPTNEELEMMLKKKLFEQGLPEGASIYEFVIY